MKFKFAILFFALFLSFQTTFAQAEKEIAAIRAQVAAIDKAAPRYKKATKTVENISLEGTEANYFSSDKGLEKIAAKIFGETFNATAEFYYQNDALIFVFYKINRYDRSIGTTKSPKVVRTEERRFYFKGDRLIRLLDGKTEVKTDHEKYETMRDEMIDVAEKLKAAHKN